MLPLQEFMQQLQTKPCVHQDWISFVNRCAAIYAGLAYGLRVAPLPLYMHHCHRYIYAYTPCFVCPVLSDHAKPGLRQDALLGLPLFASRPAAGLQNSASWLRRKHVSCMHNTHGDTPVAMLCN